MMLSSLGRISSDNPMQLASIHFNVRPALRCRTTDLRLQFLLKICLVGMIGSLLCAKHITGDRAPRTKVNCLKFQTETLPTVRPPAQPGPGRQRGVEEDSDVEE
jgi:hypothetical protein